MVKEIPPRWDLTNVYPALASKEYAADLAKLNTADRRSGKFGHREGKQDRSICQADELADVAARLIDGYNAILLVAGTLRSYIESFVSTNSYDQEALKKQSEIEQVLVKVDKLEVQTRAWIGKVAGRLAEFISI